MLPMHEFTTHDDVELNTEPLDQGLSLHEFEPLPRKYGNQVYQDASKLKGKHEADSGTLVARRTGERPLLTTLALGYGQHYAVSITPDSMWLTLIRGLTDHIDQDPEGMRKHFVNHKGKVMLIVDGTGEIRKGDPTSNWGFTFSAFSEQLKAHLGAKHSLIVSDFSTTTPIDRLSSEVTLMGAMKHYFEYKVTLCCGFPSIRIEGTPNDWENIRDRVDDLADMGLLWWTQHLGPTIDQFIRASKGQPEIDFLRRAYVPGGGGSGPRTVGGWINTLYPYTCAEKGKLKRNAFLDWEKGGDDRWAGNEVDDFPISLVEAPVELDDNGTKYNMMYYGGLVGCTYDPVESRVRPTSGWFIRDVTGEEANI